MSPDPRAEGLRALLASHAPADTTEQDAVAAVVSLLSFDEAFSASRFDPGHVTASAFVLHPSRSAVALVLHSKIGRWLQPGGHVESDDLTTVDAALREVREEVGVGAADAPWLCDVDVHVFPSRGAVPMHLHHDIRVAFRADSDRVTAGDGADDARWWPLAEVLGLEESLARPARKILRRLAGD